MSAKDEAYEIEPEDERPESPGSPSPSPRPEPPASSPEKPPDKSVHALDICPNCGAPMRGGDTLVCLRCGYDLKTMQVVKTKTGETTAADEDDEPSPALARPGGPSWIPTALLAGGMLVLVVATLAGWRGVFPGTDPEEAIPFGARLLGLARLPVLLGVWTTCAMIGLTVVAWLTQRPLGDLPLALGRAAGIAAAAMTVTLVTLPKWRFGEIALECASATFAYFALTLVLFRLTPRDAGKAALFALVTFVVIAVGARLVIWAV